MAKAGDARPRIAFLHGLESGPRSYKAQALAKIGVVRCVQMPVKRLTSLWENPWFSAAFVVGLALFMSIAWLGLILARKDDMEGWFSVLVWLGAVLVGVGGIVRMLQHGVRFIVQQCVLSQCEMLSDFDPTVVVASSFGGAVVLQLLNSGLWSGPTVLLNSAHAQVAWYAGADDSCARVALHTAAALARKAASGTSPLGLQEELVCDWTGKECASAAHHTASIDADAAKVRSRAVRPAQAHCGTHEAAAAAAAAPSAVRWDLSRGVENARAAASAAPVHADTLGMLLGWASTPSFTEEGMMLRGLLESLCLEQLSPVQSAKSWAGGLAPGADIGGESAFEPREYSWAEGCLSVVWQAARTATGAATGTGTGVFSPSQAAATVSERLRVSQSALPTQASLVVVGSTGDAVVPPADSVALVRDTLHCVSALAARDGAGTRGSRVSLFSPPGGHSLRELTHEDLGYLCAAAVALSRDA
jgi:hypothetical protein